MKIKDLPKSDRPREKLVAKGAENLKDSELLAILLRTGKAGKNVIEVASQILTKYSKKRLLQMTYHDLEKISKELFDTDLNDINIKSIIKKCDTGFDEYELETVDGKKIIIQDLVDVRYDFIKDSLRSSDQNESERMRNEINILLVMIKKIEEMIK